MFDIVDPVNKTMFELEKGEWDRLQNTYSKETPSWLIPNTEIRAMPFAAKDFIILCEKYYPHDQVIEKFKKWKQGDNFYLFAYTGDEWMQLIRNHGYCYTGTRFDSFDESMNHI